MREAEPSHPQQPRNVGAEDPRFVLVGRLVERRAAERPARVVDEDVEPAKRGDRLLDKARTALGDGHVEIDWPKPTASAPEQEPGPGAALNATVGAVARLLVRGGQRERQPGCLVAREQRVGLRIGEQQPAAACPKNRTSV